MSSHTLSQGNQVVYINQLSITGTKWKLKRKLFHSMPSTHRGEEEVWVYPYSTIEHFHCQL